MSEEFLQYIWQHQLFENDQLFSVDNKRLEIISCGVLNTDAGPDFTNARIKIEETIWAGNIEIHTDSKNWKLHQHDTNQVYNNVILHVVDTYSSPAFNSKGDEIPTLEIKPTPHLLKNFNRIKYSENSIPCSEKINVVDAFTIKMWLDSLCIERLENKTAQIEELLDQNKNNWEESFYFQLLKSFGFKTNSLPFEMLARATPLKIVSKYSNNLFQTEALLFGQAGLLEDNFTDTYPQSLQSEYRYFQKVHKLTPIEGHLWKFMRLRPGNFPTIRLAQLAYLIHRSKRLFSKVMKAASAKDLHELFSSKTSKYWNTHYTFEGPSVTKKKAIGKIAINGLLINTVIPFIFIYGKRNSLSRFCTRAVDFLEELPAESNKIIALWKELEIRPKNAGQSQALIELTNNYCSEKNCLYCQIGNKIITSSN
jgi:hypothetical protein